MLFPGTQEHHTRGVMKTIPDFAREILNRSATPALPLPRLLEATEEATAGQVVNAEQIIPEIRSRPDLFCVLDPMIGPWRRATAKPGEVPPWNPRRGFSASIPTPGRSSVSARTAESIRYLGRRVDDNSATAVAR
jgi:hypothetical protein